MQFPEHAKILIVEDEGILAEALTSRLSSAGYDVIGVASTGADAIEEVKEHVPELILMDVRIKGPMDGIETTAAIREESDVPVIYMSGNSDPQTIDRAKVTAVSGFVTKPIQYPALGNAIEMAISKHQADHKTTDVANSDMLGLGK